MQKPVLPKAPMAIQKGVPLKLLLDEPAITQLAKNLSYSYSSLDKTSFTKDALSKINDLTLKERAFWIAEVMKHHLPNHYEEAIAIILHSLTPALNQTDQLGTASMFYLPHVCFVERYGLDITYNQNKDPFDQSMQAQYELTRRFTAEFSIRAFIIAQPERTFSILYKWMHDDDPHVRRLCTEGTRPRLPWAQKIQLLIDDPGRSMPILELLKNDVDLYVRRSVANHIGDIAKDHLDLALSICQQWLPNASPELKWVIRHALRYPAKKGVKAALDLRKAAK